jgi:hypothetical protein
MWCTRIGRCIAVNNWCFHNLGEATAAVDCGSCAATRGLHVIRCRRCAVDWGASLCWVRGKPALYSSVHPLSGNMQSDDYQWFHAITCIVIIVAV